MYTPSHFAEAKLPVLHDFIRRHSLGTLIASTARGLEAEHVPLLLVESRGDYGALQGHVARANPIWQVLPDGADVLVVFQGPHHYVSPSWYPAKQEHGRVVPTWNYVVVHARGRITWNRERAWLRDLLERTIDFNERAQPHPWRLTDAPAEFVEPMLDAIVGFEIPIASLQGKWSSARAAARAIGWASSGGWRRSRAPRLTSSRSACGSWRRAGDYARRSTTTRGWPA
ncbi:MAG TPA: FMN-binding negative transcriptional regulator [Gammaproteobacteria bacterium]